MNAANEIAGQAFLDGRIGFREIADIVASTLERHGADPGGSLAELVAADGRARSTAEQLLEQGARR